MGVSGPPYGVVCSHTGYVGFGSFHDWVDHVDKTQKEVSEMARCDKCIHFDVCLKLVYSRIIFCGDDAEKRCKMFKSIADVAPRAEWISVEERLPEPNEECLVSARVGDRVVIDLGELVQYCDGRIFGWMTTNDWNEGEGCKITHWMPLPSAPKKEKNND